MLDMIRQGLNWPDLALLLLRVALGVFFLLARFRWIWDPAQQAHCQRWFPDQRHESLANKLYHCGYSHNPYLAGLVACVEIGAALMLIMGFLVPLAALGLAVVLLFATVCTARDKVARQNPIDTVDCICCYLWLVEPLYLIMAVCLMLTGGGAYSLDATLWR